MKENTDNTEYKQDSVETRVSTSFDGEPQETPEELQFRGEGSGKPSVCQKL